MLTLLPGLEEAPPPLLDGGGCRLSLLPAPAVFCDTTLVPALIGREGGSPGSPTGPVRPVRFVMLECLSFALRKSSVPYSEVASVATLAADCGLPSRDCEG